MPAADTRVVHVASAERQGSSGPTQDRIFTTPNAVIVLDGATRPEAGERDGGWIADALGRQLCRRLLEWPGADLVDVLRDAIGAVAREHKLTPGDSPSTTVSMLRWTDEELHALVLGDSPVVVLTTDGGVEAVRDDRLAEVAREDRQLYRSPTAPGGGFRNDRREQWQALADAQRAHRNRPGGYWIGEADPEAAANAVQARWARSQVFAALVMTDGVSDGVDAYRVPPNWHEAFGLALADPGSLIDAVHQAEVEDSAGVRWPRSKPHDDKAIAAVRFGDRGILPN
jgi:serine/threonine protein phosphatase PrpC